MNLPSSSSLPNPAHLSFISIVWLFHLLYIWFNLNDDDELHDFIASEPLK